MNVYLMGLADYTNSNLFSLVQKFFPFATIKRGGFFMQTVPFNFNAAKNLEILSKTAFLTTYHMGKTNIMPIAWGALGVMWKLPTFVAMVRKSRYSYKLIDATR